MSAYLTEEQQVAEIKRFWRTYGRSLMLALLLGLALTYGLRYWQSHQQATTEKASVLFERMINSEMNGNQKASRSQGLALVEQYAGGSYANFAALLLAKQAVKDNNLTEAIKQLKIVIHDTDNLSMRQIARLRAARIYLELKQPKQALALLEHLDDKSFRPMVQEIQGDAYIALGDNTKARQLYDAAAKALPALDITPSPLLQIKLDNLGGEIADV